MSLTPGQFAFATSKETFPALVAGYGAGKTAASIARAMALKAHYRNCNIGYYLPTYSLVTDIAHERFPDLCDRKGWSYKLNKSDNFIQFPGAGKIIFRSMDNPSRIIGYEVAHSICDELDSMPMAKAKHAWNKIVARNREKCGAQNTVAVATTPEGFRFVYEKWGKNPKPGYVIYHARTADNAANLPEGYIENLENTYSPQLLKAYLNGEFVNMESDSVYADFDRKLQHLSTMHQPGEPLHIGMDFNVRNMTAVVSVIRNDNPISTGELVKVRDTPAMAALIKDRFPGHPITIYPDASGGNSSSKNASESDLGILRQAGLTVRVSPSNPAVRDRVNAVCGMILNGKGERRWKINTDNCPVTTEAFEQQAYDKNKEPDKSTGHDHPPDAVGYFIYNKWPIIKQVAHVQPLRI